MEATDVSQRESFYAILGELYVSDVWERLNKVNFSIERKDADEELKIYQVKWLKENVPGIKIMKVRMTVEEFEDTEETILF